MFALVKKWPASSTVEQYPFKVLVLGPNPRRVTPYSINNVFKDQDTHFSQFADYNFRICSSMVGHETCYF